MASLMTTNKDLVDRHGVNLNSDGYCRTSGEIKSIQVLLSQWHIDEPYNSESSRLVPLGAAYLAMKHYYNQNDSVGGTFEGGYVFNRSLSSAQFTNFQSKESLMTRYKPSLKTVLYLEKIPYYDVTIFDSSTNLIPGYSGYKYARDDSSQILYYYGYYASSYTDYVTIPVRSFLSSDNSYDTINLNLKFFTGASSR